jgi:biopolymer transport protein ExbD
VIRFTCSACGKKLGVPTKLAGQTVSCPYCEAEVFAPEESQPERADSPSAPPHHEEHREEAALSKPSAKIDPEELIDMTAMVDIVFFLLIFFLVTAMSGIHSSTPMPNPESQQKKGAGGPKTLDEIEDDSDFIVVRINRDDAIEIEGVALGDVSEVVFRLRELRRAGSGATGLLVVGHALATHGTAVAVLDAGYDAGIEKVRLAVTDDPAE